MSRAGIEGVNKVYGTRIIIGEPTRQAAGDEILVRELDRTALDGRTVDMAIYELLGLAVSGRLAAVLGDDL